MRQSMKFLMGVCTLCTVAATTMAGLYGDTPNAKHAWAVHDRNRPNPKKITADPGKAPSDAIILFDGTSLANWTDAKGNKSKWRIDNGSMYPVRGSGIIKTKQAFGDCQLHIEWCTPTDIRGYGQQRGNSGVFLMGNYEVQVLDSYETDPDGNPNKNPNYADGQAGAVYAENPPMVNPTRAPGQWQCYDIVFHQPIWEGRTLKYPGSLTVFLNGVLIQDHWEMEGRATHCIRRGLAPHPTKLPFQLQDHGNPVRFRNIWIREIPSRYANTTHGGPAANEKDVMALRKQTAAKLFAKIDTRSTDRVNMLSQLLEVISYDKDPKYLQIIAEVQKVYLDQLGKESGATIKNRKGELFHLRNACNVLFRNHVIGRDDPLRNGILEIIRKNKLR